MEIEDDANESHAELMAEFEKRRRVSLAASGHCSALGVSHKICAQFVLLGFVVAIPSVIDSLRPSVN